MRKVSISNTTLIIKRHIATLCLVAVISACQSIVPATTPLQLSHTPSPPITITNSQIDAGWFVFDYPHNWRVVTNIASEPLHLILVSPDESIIIHVEDARNGCPVLSTDTHTEGCVGENGTQLYIWGEQNSAIQAPYQPHLEAIIHSVTFR